MEMRSATQPPASAAWFRSTRWSVVLAARDGQGHEARLALEELCRAYWPPVYAFLRRRGHSPHNAQDLAQGFFAHFLEHGFLRRLHLRDGRFRSFLLTFLKRFASDERDKANAMKRGGGLQFVSWEDCALEEVRQGGLESLSASEAFDRRWAMSLLGRAQDHLREEYASAGKESLYEALQTLLGGEPPEGGYAGMAGTLGMPENSLKSAVHRLRRRYGVLIREEVAQTVEMPPLIDEEIRYLLTVVAH